jgi:hypothetical protein
MRRLPVLLMILVVGACAPTGHGTMGGEHWTVGEVASSLEVGVLRGEIRLALRITNTSGTPLEITFPTSQRYDFVVTREDGVELWRWSADRAFAQVVTEARLEPGETWSMEATLAPAPGSGRYLAVGRLTSPDYPVEQQAPFEIP